MSFPTPPPSYTGNSPLQYWHNNGLSVMLRWNRDYPIVTDASGLELGYGLSFHEVPRDAGLDAAYDQLREAWVNGENASFNAGEFDSAVSTALTAFNNADLIDYNNKVILTHPVVGFRKLIYALHQAEVFGQQMLNIFDEFTAEGIQTTNNCESFSLATHNHLLKIEALDATGDELTFKQQYLEVFPASRAFNATTISRGDGCPECGPWVWGMDGAGGAVGALAGGGIASVPLAGLGTAGASWIAQKLEYAWDHEKWW